MHFYFDLLRTYLSPIFRLPLLILSSIPLVVMGKEMELKIKWFLHFQKRITTDRIYFHSNVIKFFNFYREYYGDTGEVSWVIEGLLKELPRDKFLYNTYAHLFNDGSAIAHIVEWMREDRYIKNNLELINPCSNFYKELYARHGDLAIDYRYLLDIK